ncbi:MAG: hypothetical protein M3Y62_07150 [Candidatus Dormibacteraeota bacterium]|nr:hypothetical protein [Candidatus Dormibacteraeota bacterium]
MTDYSTSTGHDPVAGEGTGSTYESGAPAFGESGSSGATEQAKQVVQEKVDQAKDVAQQAAGTAKDQVSQQVDTHSTTVGEQVGSVSEAMRKAGDHLRSQGSDMPAQLAERAAEQVEKLGSYLRNTDGNSILSDVEDFARRQPLIVMAGGVALGVVAARMLKASSQRSYSGGTSGFFSGSSGSRQPYTGSESYTGGAASTYAEPVDTTTAGTAGGGWSGEPATGGGQWGTHAEPGTAGAFGDQAETGTAGTGGWTGEGTSESQGWGQQGGDPNRRQG